MFNSFFFSLTNSSLNQIINNTIKNLLIILIVLFGFTGSIIKTSAFEHPGGLHTKTLLNTVREKILATEEPQNSAFYSLIDQADSNLSRIPEPVEDFNVPGYYDDP